MTLPPLFPALLAAGIVVSMVAFFIWWSRGASTPVGRHDRALQLAWGVTLLSVALTAYWVSGHRTYWPSAAMVLSLIAEVQVLFEVRRSRKLKAEGD